MPCLTVVALLVLLAVVSIFGMGGEFLPPFNEGTLTIGLETPPSTSLQESDRIGTLVEQDAVGNPGSDPRIASHGPG